MLRTPYESGELLTEAWLMRELQVASAGQVAADERLEFGRLRGSASSALVLYGAGNLGRRTLTGLRAVGIEPVAFVDASPTRQRDGVDGLRVLSPSEAAAEFGEHALFVVTVWSPSRRHEFGEIHRSLASLGVKRLVSFVSLYRAYADQFLPYYCLDLPHRLYQESGLIREAYRSLADGESRDEFLRQLTYLLSLMDVVDIPRGGNPVPTYFPPDLVTLRRDEVFIDCGAYDGDTCASLIEESGGAFDSVIAFEPDPAAAAQLAEMVEQLQPQLRSRVRVIQAAVSDENGTARFEGGGTPGSRVSEGGTILVPTVKLDTALADQMATFVKMDIEGAELGALRGSSDLIRRARPILAVCVYHEQDHLYRVPLLLRDLCFNYEFYLRRQGPDGDLVCFAIPEERLEGRHRVPRGN